MNTYKIPDTKNRQVFEDKLDEKDDPCLIRRAMEEENKKPISRRSYAFMISCPCKRCNPFSL